MLHMSTAVICRFNLYVEEDACLLSAAIMHEDEGDSYYPSRVAWDISRIYFRYTNACQNQGDNDNGP